MFRILEEHGIRPWEFGELTVPALLMILRRGASEESEVGLRRSVRRARETARMFAKMRIGG